MLAVNVDPAPARALNKLLGFRPTRAAPDLHSFVRGGAPYASYHGVFKHLALTQRDQARVLGLGLRTWDRVRTRKKPLSPEASDRLVRVARVYSELLELWNDPERSAEWLQTPNASLGDVTPLSLLDTDPGIRRIANVIARLKYGIFS